MISTKTWEKLNTDQKVGTFLLAFLVATTLISAVFIQRPTASEAGAASLGPRSCRKCVARCERYTLASAKDTCLSYCKRYCPQPTPTPLPTRYPTPTPTSTCGNNICEPGEADQYDCPVCNPGDTQCSLRPCYLKPGTCPEDCKGNGRDACTKAGGTWREFPNSCADSCQNPYVMDTQNARPYICLDVITEGCDCGPDLCWNGTTCVKNPPEIKKNYPQ